MGLARSVVLVCFVWYSRPLMTDRQTDKGRHRAARAAKKSKLLSSFSHGYLTEKYKMGAPLWKILSTLFCTENSLFS